jgi:EAL and modified HD-GYP domain-containing signal transduction protein
MNSAMFAWERPIDSIRHALALLGTDQIRKWIGLLALSALTDRSPALTPVAIIRARFCELIASAAGDRSRGSELFLLGMLSLFEAILHRPISEIIEHIDLKDDIREALVHPEQLTDTVAIIHSLVRAYEAGNWDSVATLANRLDISTLALGQAYQESVAWAEDQELLSR